MYGILLESVQHFLTKKFSEAKWNEIRERAGICNHMFITHTQYSESLMTKIADTAAEILGEETDMLGDDFMQYFGTCFVKFFSHYGYDRVIKVSGRCLRDFLIGIDNLHEHMRFGYPQLQSPSFFCEEETSSGLILHYTSKRKGFMFYVVGQIKEIASQFYNMDLDVKVLGNEVVNNTTHVAYRLGFDNSGYKPPAPDLLSIKSQQGINVKIFSSIFPFSFALSQDMTINMAGHGIIASVGNRIIGNDIREFFIMRRPQAEFTWETFTTRHVVFELTCTLPMLHPPTPANVNSIQSPLDFQNGNTDSKENENPAQKMSHKPQLHLRGIMKYIRSWNKVIYICSPLIGGIEEMMRLGLYMNDLSLHDMSREMVLSAIKPTHQLEKTLEKEFEKGKALEENMENLALMRKQIEELPYRRMPKAIADRLRLGGKAVGTCEKFESVTVMVSYMDGFESICSQVGALEIVSLANDMFTIFDKLTEKHDVYKVETSGDAMYMTVSGAPVKNMHHAEAASAMALDMLEAVKKIKNPVNKKPMTVSIGMHSGPVAAGLVGEKTPQYCLFGDTVNIALRLRTTALPMRVHISETTKRCLENTDFRIEFRGPVEIKGKGKTRTFWLSGQRTKS